jgi:hypothetical protein
LEDALQKAENRVRCGHNDARAKKTKNKQLRRDGKVRELSAAHNSEFEVLEEYEI